MGAHIQAPNQRKGQTENNDVRQQVGNGVAIVEFYLVDAMLRDSDLPSSLDWRAREDLCEDNANHPARDNQTDRSRYILKRLDAEDAAVHEKDRELDCG